MALKGTRAVGDDQAWKTEVEKEIREILRQLSILQSQVRNLNRR